MRFGRLIALKVVGKSSSHGGNLWECICDCGNKTIIPTSKLMNGHTKSCGCYMKEMARIRHTKHGYTCHNGKKPRLYKIWLAMRERCCYPKNIRYNAYGARGIRVCEEWQNFGCFKEWALSHGYTDELTIDRIDPNKGYSPINCQWISRHLNTIKQRKAILFCCNGVVESMSKWAKILHIAPYRLKNMYVEQGKDKTENFICNLIKLKNILVSNGTPVPVRRTQRGGDSAHD